MDKFLIRKGGQKRPTEKEPSAPPPKTQKIKKPVGKESTIKGWNMDWIQVARQGSSTGEAGMLALGCVACQSQYRGGKSKGAISTDPYLKGTAVPKKSSAQKHENSDTHKDAYVAWKQEKCNRPAPIVDLLHNMEKAESDRMVKLFDIAYNMAKNELPFTLFPSFISLEQKHGVDLGNTYHNDKQARTFTGFIADDLRGKLRDNLLNQRDFQYFSVLTDGSTDRSTKERELVYLKLLENGLPTMKYLGIYDVESADSKGLLQCLRSALDESGIKDWQLRLVGYGADGAAVNFGCKGGVFQRLQEDLPWLVGTHCVAHRLELAVKDAFKDTYFATEIDSVLTGYRAFYSRSPKRLKELEDLADILQEEIIKPKRAEGTRWVEHRRRALIAFDRNFPVVAAHLEDTATNGKGEDRAKATGWLRKIVTKKFVLHYALYLDLLGDLSRLSLQFQRDDLSIPDVLEAIGASPLMQGQAASTPKLNAVRHAIAPENKYKGVSLQGSSSECDETKKMIIEKLADALEHRFSSFSSSPVLKAVRVLDPQNWPEDLVGVGDDEINLLLDHFQAVLESGEDGYDCMVEDARCEWPRLRAVVAKCYQQGMTWNAMWCKLFTRKDLANILHIFKIVQVLPLSTSKVERAFSFMKRIKNDWRASLDSETVHDLLTISLEGPSEKEFQAQGSVKLWWGAGKQRRRPTVLPYGKRISETSQSPES